MIALCAAADVLAQPFAGCLRHVDAELAGFRNELVVEGYRGAPASRCARKHLPRWCTCRVRWSLVVP